MSRIGSSRIGSRMGACAAIAALAVAASPFPAAAFVVRLGPYHISVPLHLRHHHHHHPAPRPAEVARPERAPPVSTAPSAAPPTQVSRLDFSSAPLDPQLALAAATAGVFTSVPVLRPFGYSSMLKAAFAKTPPSLCRQNPDVAAVITPIDDAIQPDQSQADLLQKLGDALAHASDLLASSCDKPVPARPTERLRFMASQLAAAAAALDTLHRPLQNFQKSLNDEQRARLAILLGGAPMQANQPARTPDCGSSAAAVDRSFNILASSVQLGDRVHSPLDDLRAPLERASGDLERACAAQPPPSAPSRLDAAQTFLDTTHSAADALATAFATFESHLNDEQKRRFEATNFAGL